LSVLSCDNGKVRMGEEGVQVDVCTGECVRMWQAVRVDGVRRSPSGMACHLANTSCFVTCMLVDLNGISFAP
jgi:hypothetical protein